VDQPPSRAGSEPLSRGTGILRANTDDPRFSVDADDGPDRHPEWTGSSAGVADLTELIGDGVSTVRSPTGLVALVDSVTQASGELISSLVGDLLSHWSQ
jgi:hypothetical protein